MQLNLYTYYDNILIVRINREKVNFEYQSFAFFKIIRYKRRKNSMKPKKPTLEDQLAFISAQHNVYPTELFQALIQAKEHGKSVCEDLTVEYRGSVNDQAIFLIKKDSNVVSQFRVPEETLSKTMFHSIIRWTQAEFAKK